MVVNKHIETTPGGGDLLTEQSARAVSFGSGACLGEAIYCLHQPAADEVQGLLGSELADFLPVAAECALGGFVLLCIGDRDVDPADGLFFGGAGGAGDACYAQSQGGSGAQANAVGECFGDLIGDGAMLGDESGGTPAKACLRLSA